MLLAAELLPGNVTLLFSKARIRASVYLVEEEHCVSYHSAALCFSVFFFLFFWMSQLVNFFFFFFSSRHCVILTWHIFLFFSTIHSVGGHGNGVVFHRKWCHHEHRPPTLLNALPKGTLRGNRKVSLSRGFVKCNIIRGGEAGTPERKSLLLLPTVTYYNRCVTFHWTHLLNTFPLCFSLLWFSFLDRLFTPVIWWNLCPASAAAYIVTSQI